MNISLRDRLFQMTLGFISILTGLVVILTLGSKYPSWEFDFVSWVELRRIKRRRDNEHYS